MPTGSRPVGEDGILAAGTKAVKIELVMLRRLVPPPEKREEPLPAFEWHVMFAYDVARNVEIPLPKAAESDATNAASPPQTQPLTSG